MGSSAELAVAVSDAGGLGSLGCWRRPPEDVEWQLSIIRRRTSRPFAMNHLVTELNETAFGMTLTAKPAMISLALGDPGELVKRAHDAGSLVVHQVTTTAQARQAAERGVDVIVAQGGEAGGYGGIVAALALIPQVVDAVSPLPVVAAGGIADGRAGGSPGAGCGRDQRGDAVSRVGRGANQPNLETEDCGRRRRGRGQDRVLERDHAFARQRRLRHGDAGTSNAVHRDLARATRGGQAGGGTPTCSGASHVQTGTGARTLSCRRAERWFDPRNPASRRDRAAHRR